MGSVSLKIGDGTARFKNSTLCSSVVNILMIFILFQLHFGNLGCMHCFDLVNGYENQRFVKSRSKNDFLVADVLALGNGGIRIGFDIGIGSGSFAAVMAERNVTIVTSTLNIDAPFNEFIAAGGLFPLFLSLDHRFPFYDNVFDLVRATNTLDDDVGKKQEKLEFLMFDVDRIFNVLKQIEMLTK
ncbi:hypothetical protein MtrunA17_Chr3g0113501 [Medicago truncatula]|uniref:S-adenosyl-L-methionine-dependent methyltransferase n=1 Tax=Medicago truncatula TaxID=3880 RepID=A0A396IUP2_MEDTR|nr:hypothetical protein MtrunA17_Chr3g0113501 [Medicago truncatula]